MTVFFIAFVEDFNPLLGSSGVFGYKKTIFLSGL